MQLSLKDCFLNISLSFRYHILVDGAIVEKRHGIPFPGSGHLEAVEDDLSMRHAILLALVAQLLH